MRLQSVQDGIPPGGKLLPTRLALQILDLFLRTVLPVGYQRVELLVGDVVVITARVGAEVALCRKPLLTSPATLPHVPWLGKLTFDRAALSLLLHTKAAVALRLRIQHHRLARSLCFFLMLQQPAKPKSAQETIQLEYNDQNAVTITIFSNKRARIPFLGQNACHCIISHNN